MLLAGFELLMSSKLLIQKLLKFLTALAKASLTWSSLNNMFTCVVVVLSLIEHA